MAAISEAGVRPNKTIQGTIGRLHLEQGSAAVAEIVRNALSSLAEQQEQGTVRNPGGFLTAALRRGFTANQAKAEAREKRQQSPPTREKAERAPAINEISSQIDHYLAANQRDWAIAKLRSLWDNGWHDFLEELLQLRSDWSFSVTSDGVQEMGHG
ncbi:MAG TPA: hypothetical protein V6D18_09855 [Thermosynechococcaceae cyanobacterium]